MSLARKRGTITSVRGTRTLSQRILITNPIAYWSLRETSGTSAIDLKGLSNGTYSSVTLNNAVFPRNNYPAPKFLYASSSRVNVYSASLSNAFPGSAGSMMCYVKLLDAATMTDGNQHYLMNFQVDTNNYISLLKDSSTYLYMFYYCAGGTSDNMSQYYGKTDWIQLCATWSKTNERVRLYIDRVLVQSSTALGVWSGGALSATYAALGARTNGGLTPHNGWLGHCALWNRELTQTEINNLYFDEFPSASGLLCVGDSKTDNDAWLQLLADALTTQTGSKWVARPDIAVGGDDVGELKLHIDADLAVRSDSVSKISISIGANDAVEPTPETSFKTNLTYVINALRTKYPSASIYIAKVWRRTYGANCALLNGYIDAVIATYSSGVYVGHNESIWMENGDDGVTYTTDGVHYSNWIKVRDVWMTAFGY